MSASSATFDVTALGTTTIKWIAEDNVGNVSTVSTQDVELDTTPPNAPTLAYSGFSHAYYPGSGSTVFFQGGGSGGFTVGASGSTDADSGPVAYTYPSLGSGWSNTNGAYTFTGGSATQSGSVTAQNSAGLSSTGSSFTAHADSSAPTTAVTCNAVACSAGWYLASPVGVTITAAGETGESGVKRIVYTTDGSDPAIDGSDTVTTGTEVSGASASLNVSAEGATTIKWIAEDNVGNITAVGSKTVQIDTIAPNTTIGAEAERPELERDPDLRLLVQRGRSDVRVLGRRRRLQPLRHAADAPDPRRGPAHLPRPRDRRRRQHRRDPGRVQLVARHRPAGRRA